jgi:hypothetical protein
MTAVFTFLLLKHALAGVQWSQLTPQKEIAGSAMGRPSPQTHSRGFFPVWLFFKYPLLMQHFNR